MDTEILDLMEEGEYERILGRACEVLRDGGIVAYPTDTLYGLGVDPSVKGAMQRLFELKGRDEGKSVSLLFSSKEMILRYFKSLSELENKLIDKFLPGAITLVLASTLKYDWSPSDTIGVRVPDNAFCKDLVENYGNPITTTSANKSGEPPARTVEELKGYFESDIELILNGGNSPESKGSTVVRVIDEEIVVLREGILSGEDIVRRLDGR